MRAPTKNEFSIRLSDLWRNLIVRVPVEFRPTILQRELDWSKGFLRSVLGFLCIWYASLILFSDSQKPREIAIRYSSIRMVTIAFSITAIFFLSRYGRKKTGVSLLSAFLGFAWMMSYTVFSFYPLPIRTSWITLLPASILMTTAVTGRNAVALYAVYVTLALLVFRQEINTIYVVSDLVFGAVIIFAGVAIKHLLAVSVILELEREREQRLAFNNELKMYEALETFIPKAIKKKIRTGLSGSDSLSKVLNALANPNPQHVAVLYSDYRNYSTRSNNVDFIKSELVASSAPIVGISEEYDGFVQNRGDSLLAVFMDQSALDNVLRAVLAGLCSARSEYLRVEAKGQQNPDRYIIITSGDAVFCSLGDPDAQQLTIAGKPANLGQRLDELTKKSEVRSHLVKRPCILIDFESKKTLVSAGIQVPLIEIDLKSNNLEVRSYDSEKRIFVVEYSLELEKSLRLVIEKRNSNQNSNPQGAGAA